MKAEQEGAPPHATARQPGRLRAFILAVVVHAAFFALIVFGVTWQSSPTAPVVAELWDRLPSMKSPPPPPPEPQKTAPEPPKPEPPKPPPEPPKEEAKPEPPKPDPAIAEKLEREKRIKEKRERLEQERLEKRQKEEARKKEETEKRKREEDKRQKEEERARQDAEKARQAAASARQAEFNRYVDAIRAKIRGKANVPDTVTGHPEARVRIRILPGGEVLDIAIVKASGNPVYDTAIERAIRSAQPLPVPPADSELFPQFRDLILNIEHDR